MKKRIAEIMHVVEAERDNFLEGAINPDEETKGILWMCGVRSQQYFALGELIFMTFEYEGHDFDTDMDKMAKYLKTKGHLIEKRRKDVPVEERDTTNWWAPVKRLGSLLDSKPHIIDSDPIFANDYRVMLDGYTHDDGYAYDIRFDEDDWSETHF